MKKAEAITASHATQNVPDLMRFLYLRFSTGEFQSRGKSMFPASEDSINLHFRVVLGEDVT